jgi:antitoxin VapB
MPATPFVLDNSVLCGWFLANQATPYSDAVVCCARLAAAAHYRWPQPARSTPQALVAFAAGALGDLPTKGPVTPGRFRRLHCLEIVYTPGAVPLNIRSEEANQLAAEVAIITGETKTDAVIQSLKERLDRLRLQQEARAVKQESRRDQLDRIALRCAARPILDQRSADEICGYDANGLPC